MLRTAIRARLSSISAELSGAERGSAAPAVHLSTNTGQPSGEASTNDSHVVTVPIAGWPRTITILPTIQEDNEEYGMSELAHNVTAEHGRDTGVEPEQERCGLNSETRGRRAECTETGNSNVTGAILFLYTLE